MTRQLRTRLGRLEEAAAITGPEGTRFIRRVVGADGNYTGQEYHSEGGGEWREVFNTELAGKRAPGTTARPEEEV
jgi:hypothetical protein